MRLAAAYCWSVRLLVVGMRDCGLRCSGRHVFGHLAVPSQGSSSPYQSTLRNTPEEQRSHAGGLFNYLPTELRGGVYCSVAVCRCAGVPCYKLCVKLCLCGQTHHMAGLGDTLACRHILRHFGISWYFPLLYLRHIVDRRKIAFQNKSPPK